MGFGLLYRWDLREPGRLAIVALLFLVSLFSFALFTHEQFPSSAPVSILATKFLGAISILYVFAAPLVAALAVTVFTLDWERGLLAEYATLSFTKTQILVAKTLSVLTLTLAPVILAALVAAALQDPHAAATSYLAIVGPQFWLASVRVLSMILFFLFTTMGVAILNRRAIHAFIVPTTAFYLFWYISDQVGGMASLLPPKVFWDILFLTPRGPIWRVNGLLYVAGALMFFVAVALHFRYRRELG